MKGLLVFFIVIVCSFSSNGQSMQALYDGADGSSARVRAHRQMADSTKDSSTIKLLESWVRAVPNDGEAFRQLETLYRRNGRVRDADYADSLAIRYTRYPSSRHKRRSIPQSRFGSYEVLLPSVIKPVTTYPLIVVFHGNGNSPALMRDWFARLGLDSIIAVFPEAPYTKMADALATHQVKYSASGSGIGLQDSMFAESISLSAEWYHDVIQDARKTFPVSKELPILIGFSQGGFYAYVIATRYPSVAKSVVTISASMYPEGGVEAGLQQLNQYGIDVLVTHGTKDPVVPFQTGELISGMLTEAHIDHKFVPFNGGHWPSHEINARIHQWIVEHLR